MLVFPFPKSSQDIREPELSLERVLFEPISKPYFHSVLHTPPERHTCLYFRSLCEYCLFEWVCR